MDYKLKVQIFSLLKKQPWLAAREDKLESLFLSFPENSDREILFHLLYNFNFLDSTLFSISIKEIIEIINNQASKDINKFQICAATGDKDADSGQWVLYSLKSEPYSRILIKGIPLRNSIHSASSILEERPNIFIIDEFSGTGKTIVSRIKHLRGREKEISQKLGSDFKLSIRVLLIAGMSEAYKSISEFADFVYFTNTIEKGLSFHFKGLDLFFKKEKMIRIEDKFDKNDDFYHFGYGASEALYARDGGNIPNNVFPVFWWEKMIKNPSWVALFSRSS